MLEKECRADISRVLIGNKADLNNERKIQVTDGMALVAENKMDRYFEVASTEDYRVTSTVIDIIKSIIDIQEPVKKANNDISIHSESPDAFSYQENSLYRQNSTNKS